MERAPRVCATCKARKKGCDKILPRCGYCTQRHLVCIYDDAPDPRRTPGDSWSAASVGSSPPNLFLHSLPSHTQMPLDGVLHTHVSHVLHISQLPLAEVSGRYFDSFHHWLPVISRELLHGVSSMHGDGYPPADYSLLLLALCLVTLNPSDDITTQAMSPQTLYLEVRMLFTQVQAMINTSTRLVQTGLLLAAYEYASGNPHAAYISIGTCARIASVLGIDKSGWKYERSESDLTSALHSFECQNIWWGMIVLERCVYPDCFIFP
ncbi:hypothetical protein N7512_001429 [Penicillium capsulatum]|nr:hypothetical protein N7512_001429 [Penicillium capsulatum]